MNEKQDVLPKKSAKKKSAKKSVKKSEEVLKKSEAVQMIKSNDRRFIKERPKLPTPPPPPPPQRKLPQRGPRVDYTEIVVPDDDHFLCE